MEALTFLLSGFATVLQPGNLMFALTGCVLGMVVGVLPGVGPAAGTAILIPVTLALDPTGAVIMLAAIYYGAMYGGTITSVLLNMPGEAASAVTCLDGYEMAKRGRAGPALAIAAIGSFVGGIFSTLGLVFLALPLSKVALTFGPPEIFSLMVIGLSLVMGLAGRSLLLALVSALLGLILAQVGLDPVMGAPRFTFGRMELLDGLGIVAVVMGLFGIGEILLNVEAKAAEVFSAPPRSLIISRQDLKDSAGPVARGTLIGFLLGLIPGIGAIVPTYLSYSVERGVSRTSEKFGTGMIQGVAGPEAANNAYANAAFVPLFTLGIPGAATTAILMGALIMNGLTPGPTLFVEQPQFIWAVIASFFFGNLILLILSLPFIPLWVSILKVPYTILIPIVLGLCVIGVYSIRNSVFDIGVMLAFGVVGYLFRKVSIPLAPLVLTFVLAPLMERALRQSLEMSQGDYSILVTRPLSLTLLLISAVVLVVSTFRAFRAVQSAESEILSRMAIDPFASLEALARGLAAGDFSSADLVRLYLDRIEALDGRLHAYVSVDAEGALRAAAAADARRTAGNALGPLDGLPVAVKDLFDIAGQVTTCGSAAWLDRRCDSTAAVVSRLADAGMIILGKTHMVEFAFGAWGLNPLMGTPWNPWDMSVHRIPGGSSSGSGVAVAAGLAPAAIGSDTGGSVRTPAALNGITGLKTTAGLISLDGALPLSRTLDTAGPLCRTARDAALLTAALSDWRPPRLPEPGTATPMAGLTVTVMREADFPIAVEPEIVRVFRETQARFAELGAHVSERAFPFDLDEIVALNGDLIAAEAWSVHRDFIEDETLPIGPWVRKRILAGRTIGPDRYAAILRRHAELSAEWQAWMADADLFLTPSLPMVACPVADADESTTPLAAFARAANFLGACALSFPAGAAEGWLPVNMQLMAKPLDEASLIRAGAAFQDNTAWHRRVPDVPEQS